jgi:hypothetical protein
MTGIVENMPAVSDGVAAVAVPIGKMLNIPSLPVRVLITLLTPGGTSNVLGLGGQETSTELAVDSVPDGGGPTPGGRMRERLNVVLGGTTV